MFPSIGLGWGLQRVLDIEVSCLWLPTNPSPSVGRGISAPKGPVKPAGNRQVTQWKPEGPGSRAGAHRALPKGLCWTGCAHSVRRGVLWGAATGSRWELGKGSDEGELCLRLVLEGLVLAEGEPETGKERESGAR